MYKINSLNFSYQIKEYKYNMKNLSKLANINVFKRSFSGYIGKNMSEINNTFYAKDLIIE